MTDIVNITEPVTPDYQRDRWERPLILPPVGGKPTAYTRSSSWSKKLKDMYIINQWEKRCSIAGQARTPSLIARTLAIPMSPKEWSPADKEALDLIAEEAKVAARGNEAADIGTALHKMTERLDLGESLGELPEPYASDIAAYQTGMAAHGFQVTPEWVECRLVCDELRVAGSCDRILGHNGRLVIEDLKTGQSVDFSGLDFAVQLAVYAHSVLYNVVTGERTPIDIAQDIGYIVHLPAGQGTFSLYEVDLVAGWEAAQLCSQIDGWRKRKNLITPVGLPVIPRPQPVAPTFEARIANLRERCQTIVSMSKTAAEMLRMNLAIAGINLRTPELTSDFVYAATLIVEAAEREASAPFTDLAATTA